MNIMKADDHLKHHAVRGFDCQKLESMASHGHKHISFNKQKWWYGWIWDVACLQHLLVVNMHSKHKHLVVDQHGCLAGY